MSGRSACLKAIALQVAVLAQSVATTTCEGYAARRLAAHAHSWRDDPRLSCAGLYRRGALLVAATHDGELMDLLSRRLDPHYFMERIGKTAASHFDYVLHAGRAPAQTRSRFWRLVGCPEDVLADARVCIFPAHDRRASSFAHRSPTRLATIRPWFPASALTWSTRERAARAMIRRRPTAKRRSGHALAHREIQMASSVRSTAREGRRSLIWVLTDGGSRLHLRPVAVGILIARRRHGGPCSASSTADRARALGRRGRSRIHHRAGARSLPARLGGLRRERHPHDDAPHGLLHGRRRAAFDELGEGVRMTRYGGDCYAYGLLAMGFIDLIVEGG